MSTEFADVELVEAWKKYPWLRSSFSTRLNGESSVYGEGDLNLGWTDSDEPAIVARNRARFVAEAGAGEGFQLVTVKQFHSNLIRHVDLSQTSLMTADGKSVMRGDGLATNVSGLLLGVQTADCVPVLVVDVRLRVVAAFHAGWRGTLGRIVQRGVGDFALRYGSQSGDVIAAIGPCIRQCCFQVGGDVCADFESQFTYGTDLFTRADEQGRSFLDLVAANRRQLLDAGVSEGNISVVGECTACARTEGGRRKYFSYRAEHGFTGRMLSVIGIAAD